MNILYWKRNLINSKVLNNLAAIYFLVNLVSVVIKPIEVKCQVTSLLRRMGDGSISGCCLIYSQLRARAKMHSLLVLAYNPKPRTLLDYSALSHIKLRAFDVG